LIQIGPWGQTSDRELKIQGRHSRNFYTHADKLLREEVTLARLLEDGTTSAAVDDPQQELLRQSIEQARADLLATYSEVEQ
jgi:anaerobic magnesium-protoporphyrin IX monomethyl ester cyclase